MQKEEAECLLKQTEQQVSILKASLDRATKAKEHAEAQVSHSTVRFSRSKPQKNKYGLEARTIKSSGWVGQISQTYHQQRCLACPPTTVHLSLENK